MSKVLFLTIGIDLSKFTSGIAKKIYSQVEGLRSNINEIILCGNHGNDYYIGDQKVYSMTGKKLHDQIKIFEKLSAFAKRNKINALYIRKINFFPNYFKQYKHFFKLFNKVVLEIPTYPYLNEIKSKKNKLFYILEIFFIKYILSKYIDKIVTFSEHNFIYGIETIRISNGVPENKYNLVKELKNKKEEDNILNIISVSSMDFWHGIDRAIISLANYKSDKKIILHIVGGDDNKIKKLKKLACSLNVDGNVKFYGLLEGDDLHKVYLNADMGMGSLARHRSKIYQLSSLKNKEYLAYGLPLFYSENDLDLDGQSFVFKILADESDVNYNSLVNWFDKLEVSNLEIMKFSENFTWSKQMKKVDLFFMSDDK